MSQWQWDKMMACLNGKHAVFPAFTAKIVPWHWCPHTFTAATSAFSNLNINILLGIFHLKRILSSGWGREWRAASSLPGWERSSAGNVLTPKWVPFLRSPVWSQGCNAHMEQFMRIKSFYLVYRARPALSVSLFSDCRLELWVLCGWAWEQRL